MNKIVEPNKPNHYAMIEDGRVVGVVVWDGLSDFDVADLLVPLSGVDPEPGIGWDYDGKTFVDNRPIFSDGEAV